MKAKRIVFKVGTSSLTNPDGSLSRQKVKVITQQLALLHESGHELILVSSGAAQTFKGAASMVLETGQHPGSLKDAVCSPGGSTIAGVNRLEQVGVRGDIIAGVEVAYKRTQEMGKEAGKN